MDYPLRDEKVFKTKNLFFQYPYPDQMVRSEWDKQNRPSLLYCIYRLIVFAYFCGWLIADFLNKIKVGEEKFYLIYLTHWGLIIFNLHLLVNFLIVLLHRFNVLKLEEGQLSFCLQFHWALYNLTLVATMFVITIYWIAVYDPSNGPPDAYNLHKHLFNGFALLIDLFITAIPIRLLHFWVPQIVGILYIIFTVIYYNAGGTNAGGETYIYRILDYSSESGYKYAIAFSLLGPPLYHSVLYLLYRLRLLLAHKCCKPNNLVTPVIELHP